MNERTLLLLGFRPPPLVSLQDGKRTPCIHGDIHKDFLNLRESSREEGFDLAVVSGYRSFEDQKTIWNAKARGERPLLDDRGEALDVSQLSPRDTVFSILRWSAFPGTSRHHWGCDIDVIDKSALIEDITLTPSEADGPFGPLHEWLDGVISRGQSCGFYRPYERDLGGVAPERWHLSYAPLSLPLAKHYGFDVFHDFLHGSLARGIELVDVVRKNAEDIFSRFIINTSPPPFGS